MGALGVGLLLSSLMGSSRTGAPEVVVTISNKEPRLDSTGAPVNAHSGNIVGPINGTYFLCAWSPSRHSAFRHSESRTDGLGARCHAQTASGTAPARTR